VKGVATSRSDFFVQHYIEEREIKIVYLPTEQMIADIFTKPLHGSLFKKFADKLTGNDTLNDTTTLITEKI
jgi:hypothetical protein